MHVLLISASLRKLNRRAKPLKQSVGFYGFFFFFFGSQPRQQLLANVEMVD